MRALILFGILAFGSGCSSPLVGEWASDKKLGNGKENDMFIYSDGSGEAEIYAAPSSLAGDPAAYQRFDFEITWTDQGGYFELDMECDKGPCDGNDFVMECEIIEVDDDDQRLDCDGDDNWKNYVFNWERIQ